MAGFASFDEIISNNTVDEQMLVWDFAKFEITPPQQYGYYQSLWLNKGTPGPGVAPATTPGTSYDNDSGSINWADQSPKEKYVLAIEAFGGQNGILKVYDRLVAVSGISLASTGAKTVNSAALPRYSGTAAAGVEAWVEVTTATATTAPVVKIDSYTNEAGATGRSGDNISFPVAATQAGAFIGPLPLQAGDLGVRSVEAGLNVVTAASAGVCNVVLLRHLGYIGITDDTIMSPNMILRPDSMPRIYDGAAIALALMKTDVDLTQVWGSISVGYK